MQTTIERLIARRDIDDVLARYSRGADRCDVELLAAVFWDDATLDYGTFYRGGPVGYVDVVIEALRLDSIRTQHVLGNRVVELDGDAAFGETYAVAYHKRSGTRRPHEAGRLDIWGGRYVDRFERRDGEWRIADRRCIIDWTIGLDDDGKFAWDTIDEGTRDRNDPSYHRPR